MAFSSDTLIICATARLVRGMALRAQQHAASQNRAQWSAAQATTLALWLDDVIEQANLLGLLPDEALPLTKLSALAEAHLWEQAINDCLAKHEARALFDVRAMAQTAIEAHDLMLNWQISDADINHDFMSQETRQFLRWRSVFVSLCHSQQAMPASQLMAQQIALLGQHQAASQASINLPKRIELAGFDRITPLEQGLFDCLAGYGITIERAANKYPSSAQVTCYGLADLQEECRAAVAWAQQQLAAHPQAQLAIVSPVLGHVRRLLTDLLDDAFHPQTLHGSALELPRCYDFSLGLALAEYPLVASALQLLSLASHKASLQFEQVSALLLDHYWGQPAERDARARLDAHLRKHLNASYRLDGLIKQVARCENDGWALSGLLAQLKQIAVFQAKPKQWPSAWLADFTGLLSDLAWAQTRPLSSHEYQTQQAFYKSLQELAGLDDLMGKVSAQAAWQKVSVLMRSTVFQPEARGDTHIQLLGLLETPALQLDAIWVMNMNDQHSPAPVKLNPLLPAQVQRDLATPNASAAVQSQFAALVQQRLLHSAVKVVFSYALQEGDRVLRASPLLAGLPHSQASLPSMITLAERLAVPLRMEYLDDSLAPPLSVDEKISGGVKLLATQAVCPAWAFYQYRLGAGKLQTPVDGLDSMTRGSLLHQVLQFFWQDCQTLSRLQAMTVEERRLGIDAAIAKGIEAYRLEGQAYLPPQVLQIEQKRLHQVLNDSLDLECQRADFSVQECEKKFNLNLDGLPLNLSIDRIDCLTDGRLVVIDYKTGNRVDFKSWADERIAEPQLPIYAVLALQGQDVAAVCFAKVRSDECKFSGLAAEAGLLPKVLELSNGRNKAFKNFTDWSALLDHWHASLKAIAAEIKAGEASVRVNKESDFVYCDVLPLLRLPERAMQFEREQAATMEAGA
jgi:probable DNA repair protein